MSILPPDPLEDDTVELRVHQPDLWWSFDRIWDAEDAAIEPGQSCVYWLWSFDRLLYIGCTQGPHRRWMQHLNGKPWWREVTHIEQLVVPSHGLALHLEDRGIREQRPLYNRTGPWAMHRKSIQRRGLDAAVTEVVDSLAMPS